MFNISSNTKIYIFSPYVKTGGPRSLHQLALSLKNNGLKTYIIYYKYRIQSNKRNLFNEYSVNVADSVQDKSENIIITTETFTGELKEYKYAQKIIWWLSLDYYFIDLFLKKSTLYTVERKNLSRLTIPIIYFIKLLIRIFIKRNALKVEELSNIFHFYNCEYVHQFLLNNGIKETNTKYLCGPIDDLYFAIDKEDILANKTRTVTFNPAKIAPALLEKLKKVIHNKDATIELIELKNMTKEEVFSILCRTKVYVDLGFFPGPERIPREAVTLYCNVITSMEGSAANKIDVMIPDKYKFDINNLNMENLIELIIDMVNNFERYTNDFDSYRLKVVKQKEIFHNNIQSIFLNKGDM